MGATGILLLVLAFWPIRIVCGGCGMSYSGGQPPSEQRKPPRTGRSTLGVQLVVGSHRQHFPLYIPLQATLARFVFLR